MYLDEQPWVRNYNHVIRNMYTHWREYTGRARRAAFFGSVAPKLITQCSCTDFYYPSPHLPNSCTHLKAWAADVWSRAGPLSGQESTRPSGNSMTLGKSTELKARAHTTAAALHWLELWECKPWDSCSASLGLSFPICSARARWWNPALTFEGPECHTGDPTPGFLSPC